MTQLQDMTDQQLNRALAELMGYTVIKSGSCYQLRLDASFGNWQGEERYAWSDAPNYCNDPAASLEVQAAAIAKDGLGYLSRLSDVIEPDEPGYQQAGELIAYTLEHTVRLLTAKPRQRAEAAYLTLSGVNADGL